MRHYGKEWRKRVDRRFAIREVVNPSVGSYRLTSLILKQIEVVKGLNDNPRYVYVGPNQYNELLKPANLETTPYDPITFTKIECVGPFLGLEMIVLPYFDGILVTPNARKLV